MFRTLFILFLLVPAIELYVLIQVGGVIGALPTILLTILTAVMGAWLMCSQGVATLQRAQQSLLMGQPPQLEVIEGVMIFIGGVFLLIPGLITDFLGFLFLMPPVRHALAKKVLQGQNGRMNGQVGNIYEGQWEAEKTATHSSSTSSTAKIEIIEAEWQEVSSGEDDHARKK